jgi:L-fuculose-phosphate aldolase
VPEPRVRDNSRVGIPDLSAAIVEAGRRLGARGLIAAGEGNMSVRIAPDRILVTVTGKRKDSLTVDDVVTAWLDAGHDEPERVGPRPTSDLAIHRAIYRARPDVAAIIHAHVPAAMALTLVGLAPDPADLPETALLLPSLPVVPFAPPGSAELAAMVAGAVRPAGDGTMDDAPANAVLLERHGAIAIGPDLVTAGDRLELVDVLCRVHRDAILLRARRG